MIVYNVTINVDAEIDAEWVEWMREIHLPKVMATRCFENFHFQRLLTKQDDEAGETYCIQYYAENMEAYEIYRSQFAPALQQETLKKFGEKFTAFRTLMEII